MSKRERRAWTDEDLGELEATRDLPAKEAAVMMDRSEISVRKYRRKLAAGWTPEKPFWLPAEDAIIAEHPRLTAKQLSRLIPGRSELSIKARRRATGASKGSQGPRQSAESHWTKWSPLHLGSRTLLARTCTRCGLLLPANWFPLKTGTQKTGTRVGACRKCRSVEYRVRYASSESTRKAVRENRNTYRRLAQEITAPLAERSRQEYTEADEKVLEDPTLTVLRKALILKRTYGAVRQRVEGCGYSSAKPRLEPELDQWIIDNPNADRIEEITAMLKQSEPANPIRPDFEWDD